MKVFTYFEPDPKLNGYLAVLESWKLLWANAGFEPVVLTEVDAQKHPMFNEVDAHVCSLPTVNPQMYERACWLRWLAVEAVTPYGESSLMVDIDVVPNPRSEITNYCCGIKGTTILDIGGCPCAVYAVPGQIPSRILRWNETDTINGRLHTSDMYMFRASDFARVDVCREWGSPNWEEAEMIHLASGALHNMGFNKQRYNEALYHMFRLLFQP